MTVIQMLTKNNAKTIKQTLESLPNDLPIIIGDLGSKDETKIICKKYNTKIIDLTQNYRYKAHNILSDLNKDKNKFWIEPWEIILNGSIHNITCPSYIRVLNNNTISWEIRSWVNEKFVNPVFERIDTKTDNFSKIVIRSQYNLNAEEYMEKINLWKEQEPLNMQPHYYQSCVYLMQGKYDDFLKSSEHYMFLDKTNSMSSVMNRYYYAMVQLTHKRNVKSTLQNLNICMSVKPLMAEFWCLTGDVYYHLLNKFDMAKEFYENAILLGTRRLFNDKWPMDISKYKSYPLKMIESCNLIISKKSNYEPFKNVS